MQFILEICAVSGRRRNLLRTMATDDNKALLLLPGKRSSGKIVMFHEMPEGDYMLPTNLIADNHLWEITE